MNAHAIKGDETYYARWAPNLRPRAPASKPDHPLRRLRGWGLWASPPVASRGLPAVRHAGISPTCTSGSRGGTRQSLRVGVAEHLRRMGGACQEAGQVWGFTGRAF